MTGRLIRSAVIFACLVVAAIFVLFPFFWMLSTSFKEEGKGMSFEFIPAREEQVGPFTWSASGSTNSSGGKDLTRAEADRRPRFGYAAPDALAVSLAVTPPGGATRTVPLTRDAAGLWTVPEPLAADTYVYAFTVERDWTRAFQALYTFKHYADILGNESYPFGRYFLNSFLVSFTAAMGTVIICAFGGYVFAKKQFPGKQLLFWTFMAAMMIPGMMYMVPQFALVTRFGWMNSLLGLVVPHLANVFGLFMLKQMMEGIPDSLFEAARIDGAGEWTIFRKIVIPLSLPSLAILFLLTFVGQWSNFLWQLLVNTPESPLITLPVGLSMFKGQYSTHWEQMMAASSYSIMPIVVLFLFTQRFLIEGLTAGGVKE